MLTSTSDHDLVVCPGRTGDIPGTFFRTLFRTRTGDPLSMKKGRESNRSEGEFAEFTVGAALVGGEQGSSLYRLLADVSS
jgi:hypothetical protein